VIGEAFELLSDQQKRTTYDQLGMPAVGADGNLPSTVVERMKAAAPASSGIERFREDLENAKTLEEKRHMINAIAINANRDWASVIKMSGEVAISSKDPHNEDYLIALMENMYSKGAFSDQAALQIRDITKKLPLEKQQVVLGFLGQVENALHSQPSQPAATQTGRTPRPGPGSQQPSTQTPQDPLERFRADFKTAHQVFQRTGGNLDQSKFLCMNGVNKLMSNLKDRDRNQVWTQAINICAQETYATNSSFYLAHLAFAMLNTNELTDDFARQIKQAAGKYLSEDKKEKVWGIVDDLKKQQAQSQQSQPTAQKSEKTTAPPSPPKQQSAQPKRETPPPPPQQSTSKDQERREKELQASLNKAYQASKETYDMGRSATAFLQSAEHFVSTFKDRNEGWKQVVKICDQETSNSKSSFYLTNLTFAIMSDRNPLSDDFTRQIKQIAEKQLPSDEKNKVLTSIEMLKNTFKAPQSTAQDSKQKAQSQRASCHQEKVATKQKAWEGVKKSKHIKRGIKAKVGVHRQKMRKDEKTGARKNVS
jgi:hypothetical protein